MQKTKKVTDPKLTTLWFSKSLPVTTLILIINLICCVSDPGKPGYVYQSVSKFDGTKELPYGTGMDL